MPNELAVRRPLVCSRLMVGSSLAAALAVVCTLLTSASLQAQVSREYQLKAAFLYNFAQFVEWPPTAFAETNSPLVIGVLGIDPFGEVLDETVRGEVVQGRRFKVERYRRVDEALGCHILFISQSEDRRLEAIIAALRGRPILTVSDIDPFVPRGGMIRFLTEGNKIRLRINVTATREAKLTVSSKLLRAAKEVVETDSVRGERDNK